MSSSYSYTETSTFTVVHARHIAAKVATDLKRIQRFYGSPTDQSIADYETEVIELLKAGYIDTVTYGFRREGNWIEPTLFYAARDLTGAAADDDDPGRIRASADATGGSFYSYLTYTSEWHHLSEAEKDAFKRNMPFYRSGAPEPSVSGYLARNGTYSAGGRALDRLCVRSFS
jgi:hypothetical protein